LKAQDEIAKVNEELSRVKLKAQEQVAKAQDELLQAQQQAQEANLKAHQEIAAAQLKAKDEVHEAHVQAKDEISRAQAEAQEVVNEARLKAQEDVANVQLQAEKELAAQRMKAERDLQMERLKVDEEVAKLRHQAEEELQMEKHKVEGEQRLKVAAVESQKLEAEKMFTAQISELKKKLQHQQDAIVKGIADIPAVCMALGSSVSACDRVMNGMSELRRQIVVGGESLKEAIQRTTALQHNPDTLPNFDETKQAVGRSQMACLEVETLCKRIGITSLAPELTDIQGKFEQLLQRCQGLEAHKGSVDLAKAESDRISGDLETIVGLLVKLRDGFEKCSSRIDKVRIFIQHAQDQLGMRPEDVWAAIERSSGRGSDGALWDSMVSGIQSSFCVAARPTEPKAISRDGSVDGLVKLQLQGSKKASPYDLAEKYGLDSPEKILDEWSKSRYDSRDTNVSDVTDHTPEGARRARPAAWSTFTTHGLDGPALERRGIAKMQIQKLQKLNEDALPSSYPGAAKHRAAKRPEGAKARVGDPVIILPGRQFTGTVRFCGYTDFAAGEWVGVELSGPFGKNDGSVNGVYYFECKSLHGFFCRPNLVERVGGSNRGGDRSPRTSKS